MGWPLVQCTRCTALFFPDISCALPAGINLVLVRGHASVPAFPALLEVPSRLFSSSCLGDPHHRLKSQVRLATSTQTWRTGGCHVHSTASRIAESLCLHCKMA